MRALVLTLACWAGITTLAGAQAAAPAQRPWTILVYGGADNNADGPILEFLDSVRKAIDDDPGIELLLCIDRHEEFSDDAEMLGEDFSGRAALPPAARTRPSGSRAASSSPSSTPRRRPRSTRPTPTTCGASSPGARRSFPAKRTGLMIYSHADGRTMCPDEESRGDMGIPELTRGPAARRTRSTSWRSSSATWAGSRSPINGGRALRAFWRRRPGRDPQRRAAARLGSGLRAHPLAGPRRRPRVHGGDRRSIRRR